MKQNLNTILLKYITHELPHGMKTFQDHYCYHSLPVHIALSNNIKQKRKNKKTQSEQTITLLATIIKKKNKNKTTKKPQLR